MSAMPRTHTVRPILRVPSPRLPEVNLDLVAAFRAADAERSEARLALAAVRAARSALLRPAPDEEVGMDLLMSDIVEPGGAPAAASLAEWMARGERSARHAEVRDFVTSHRHRVLHSLRVADVDAATTWDDADIATRHALGDLRKERDCMDAVEDFATPPWAFNYILHRIMEESGAIPTWEQAMDWMRGTGRDLFVTPFRENFGLDAMTGGEAERWDRAMRWRVAKAYYSFLREVDLIVRLRAEHGLPIRYHLLADAQFKVDMWCGSALVAVMIGNRAYRSRNSGRKRRVGDMMDTGRFCCVSVEMEAPTRFGRPSLVSADGLADAADAIREACHLP